MSLGARVLVAVVLVGVGLAAILAWVVPAGQPYDEPSHWSTVQFYSAQQRLPELGEPGVTYQAQMGPVFYTVAAGLGALAGGLGADDAADFGLTRALSIALLAVVGLVTYAMARELDPERRTRALASAAIVVTLPTVILYSATVQNDTAAMVVASAAALVAVRLLRRASGVPPEWWAVRWAGLGVLVGLAAMTKVHAVALAPAILVGVLAVPRPARPYALRGAGVAAVSAAVVSGWWFVRNVALSKDVTGLVGFDRTGVASTGGVAGISDVAATLRSVISVVWVPTEYLRNAFEAPLVLRAGAGLMSVAVGTLVVGGLLRRGREIGGGPLWRELSAVLRRPEVAFAASWAGLTILAFGVAQLRSTTLSPRVMFVAAAPIVIGLVGLVARLVPRRLVGVAVVAVVGFNVTVVIWIVDQSTRIGPQPFWIAFSG